MLSPCSHFLRSNQFDEPTVILCVLNSDNKLLYDRDGVKIKHLYASVCPCSYLNEKGRFLNIRKQ